MIVSALSSSAAGGNFAIGQLLYSAFSTDESYPLKKKRNE